MITLEELKAFMTRCDCLYHEIMDNPDADQGYTISEFLEAYSAYKDALTARTLAIVQDGTCHDERGVTP